MSTIPNAIPAPPWKAGLEAARANLVPGLLVQMVMLALGLAYYFLPVSRPFFENLGKLKEESGLLFSVISTGIAGALLPEILRIFVFQKGRAGLQNFKNLLFTLPFWAFQGLVIDLFYRQQARWFGSSPSVPVVIGKMAVDQFLYNPFIAAPIGVVLYQWKVRDYRWSGEFFSLGFYHSHVIPVLVATWGVWIPMVSVVYALPSALQIPIFNLGLTGWVMIFTWMNEARRQN